MGPVPATLVRLILSAMILGVPTFLMGGTLPAAARATEIAADRGRRRVALLYGFNTLGAVIGVSLATFCLLEIFRDAQLVMDRMSLKWPDRPHCAVSWAIHKGHERIG